MKTSFLFLSLLLASSATLAASTQTEKVTFMKYCPEVPEATHDSHKKTVDDQCKTYYALGSEIVDLRHEAGSDVTTIVDKIKCITQQFTTPTATIKTVCFKKGMIDRTAQLKSQVKGGYGSPFATRRGSLGAF